MMMRTEIPFHSSNATTSLTPSAQLANGGGYFPKPNAFGSRRFLSEEKAIATDMVFKVEDESHDS